MLRELRIRNFAVIDQIEVEFGPGLNVLTGETGAGKSVLIDAILLVRGARAQVDLIRTDAETATVEATFEIDRAGPVRALLESAGLAAGEDGRLVVRREIARSGRHRAFVDDIAASVAFLERLGDALVEVHGQHEHQRLLAGGHQLELLDRFAEAEADRERVAALVTKHRAARESVERLRAADRDRAQREDVLRFQVGEIDAARLRVGEEDELRTELRRLKNVERFSAAIAEASELLADDPGAVTSRLARAVHLVDGLARLDPAYAEPAARLEAAAAEVEEAMAAIRALRDDLVFDPGRLEAIEDRLDALGRLRRKYGDRDVDVLRFRDDAAAELDRVARHEELLATEERVLEELGTELDIAAKALSSRRRGAATRLAAEVQRELRSLGMDRAVFEVAVEPLPSGDVGPRGADRVEFRMSTNPGEELKPLARVASGGELSRTMLAVVTVLAAADPVPTTIFDEVDAGIGARVAAVVAEKLANVGASRQVLCVTHLAPIAARARVHVRVTKTVRAGRTRAAALMLDGGERVAEIARMLGGDGASETALRHARELLAGGRAGRTHASPAEPPPSRRR